MIEFARSQVWRPAALAACFALTPMALVAQDAADAEPADAVDEAAAAAAAPQRGMEEVVVTARRRAETLAKVPMSVAVVSAETIDSRGVFTATSFNESVPGLRINAQIGNRNWLIPNIRGQGQTYGSRAPSVVPYLAEVPLSVLSTESLFDLQNVQVLKGPQGTLFGKVTDGGAILLTPRRPDETVGGSVEVKAGNYGLHGVSAAVNTPLAGDKLLVRAAMQVNRRDGYTIDRITGTDYDDVSSEAFRVGVIWRPSDRVENYTIVQYQHSDENGTGSIMSYYNPALPTPGALGLPAIVDANLAAGPRSTAQFDGTFSKRKTLFIANTTTWRISDDLTLKNIIGYVDRKDQIAADYDGSVLELVDFQQPTIPNFWVRQYSIETQLQGNAMDDRLDWITGVYADYSHPGGKAGNERVMFFESDIADVHEDNHSVAVFAQGSYDLSEMLVEGLKFTVGLRYTYEDYASRTFESKTTGNPPQPNGVCLVAGVPDCVLDLSNTDKVLTYNVGLDWQVNPDTLLYAVTRKGYKAGGYQIYYPRPDLNHYDAETIRDLEIGVKNEFYIGGMRGRVNLAGFYAKQDDIQRLAILVDTTGPTPTPYSYIANAAAATVKGVDFEASLLPFDSLRLDLRYTWTDYAYEKTPEGLAACTAVNSSSGKPAFCPLNTAAGTPEHQMSASLRYTLPVAPRYGQVSVTVDYSYQDDLAHTDESYTSSLTGNNYNGIEPAHSLVNASVQWRNILGRPLDLTLFGTNLTDKLYRTGVNNLSSNVGFASYFYGEPRMWGASLKYRFGGDAE